MHIIRTWAHKPSVLSPQNLLVIGVKFNQFSLCKMPINWLKGEPSNINTQRISIKISGKYYCEGRNFVEISKIKCRLAAWLFKKWFARKWVRYTKKRFESKPSFSHVRKYNVWTQNIIGLTNNRIKCAVGVIILTLHDFEHFADWFISKGKPGSSTEYCEN